MIDRLDAGVACRGRSAGGVQLCGPAGWLADCLVWLGWSGDSPAGVPAGDIGWYGCSWVNPPTAEKIKKEKNILT